MDAIRELDSRITDDIDVRLLWSERDGGLSVTVADARTGDAFSIQVRDCEDALHVFRHPYAYAAWHGLATAGMLEPDKPDLSLTA